MAKLPILIVLSIFILSGCMYKNPFPDFYKEVNPVTDDLILNFDDLPQIHYAGIDTFKSEANNFLEKGFIMLGEAHFTGGNIPTDQGFALAHGKKIGATDVLFARKLLSSRSGNLQLTTPTQDITYHSGNVNVYGSGGGYGTGSYYGSSTTYGTQTTNIPYTVSRYKVSTAFFCKSTKKPKWGVYFDDTTPQDRQNTGTNKGLKVTAVVQDSPFYESDIIRGDVITRINGYDAKLAFINDDNHPIIRADTLQIELFRKRQKLFKTIVISDKGKQTYSTSTPQVETIKSKSISDQKKQEARRRIIRLYASGAISKEEYDEMIKEIR